MQDSGGSVRHYDGVLFVLVVALFALAPPLVEWWATPDRPWYLPYLIWAAIIGAGLALRRTGRHDV